MAKRKAVRGSKRKAAKGRSSRRVRAAAKKTASRKIARKAARKVARKAKPAAPARAKGTRAIRRAKPAARPRVVAKKKATTARKAKPSTATAKATPRASSAAAPVKRTAPKAARPVARTAPGLNRERRTITDDERMPSPPSSLDLDRSASAARSGRRELLEKYEEHTETSPAMTGGDVDADWESAYSVGDEAPGGDNPTPDQDIVDDIGRAVGVQYQDNEELKGERKISERDKHRWELDPASSDDWEDR
jgi:hypothetical protein